MRQPAPIVERHRRYGPGTPARQTASAVGPTDRGTEPCARGRQRRRFGRRPTPGSLQTATRTHRSAPWLAKRAAGADGSVCGAANLAMSPWRSCCGWRRLRDVRARMVAHRNPEHGHLRGEDEPLDLRVRFVAVERGDAARLLQRGTDGRVTSAAAGIDLCRRDAQPLCARHLGSAAMPIAAASACGLNCFGSAKLARCHGPIRSRPIADCAASTIVAWASALTMNPLFRLSIVARATCDM